MLGPPVVGRSGQHAYTSCHVVTHPVAGGVMGPSTPNKHDVDHTQSEQPDPTDSATHQEQPSLKMCTDRQMTMSLPGGTGLLGDRPQSVQEQAGPH